MLRKSLIAAALLAASSGALAGHDDYVYGRVVMVEPYVSISFSSGHYDGYRVLYGTGGRRYWTHSPHHPGHVIWVPRPFAYHAYPPRHFDRDDWRHDDWRHGRGSWENHDHDGWRDHRGRD